MTGARVGRALPHDSVLHRRNPTVKLGVLLAVSGALLPVVDPVTPLVLAVLAVPAVAWAGRIPWRLLGRAQLVFAPFAVSVLAVNAVTRGGDVVAVVGGLEVTDQGLATGTSLLVRTLLVGTLSIAYVLTTDGARLMTSLHQHVHLGARPTYAVLAGYRMLEQLPERWTTIRLAQAAREPASARRTGPPNAPRALTRAAFTLLVVTLRQGERMAVAMETRGLGAGPRTVFAPVALDRRDGALAVLALGGVGAALALSAWAGTLASWGSLTP